MAYNEDSEFDEDLDPWDRALTEKEVKLSSSYTEDDIQTNLDDDEFGPTDWLM